MSVTSYPLKGGFASFGQPRRETLLVQRDDLRSHRGRMVGQNNPTVPTLHTSLQERGPIQTEAGWYITKRMKRGGGVPIPESEG